MRTVLKNIGKGLFAGLASLIVLGLIVIVSAWFFPGLLLNSGTLGLARRVLLNHASPLITWGEGTLRARSEAFNSKHLHLNLRNACIQTESFNGCFSHVELNARIGVGQNRLKVISFGPAKVVASHMNVVATSSSGKSAGPLSFTLPDLTLPKWLSEINVTDTEVELTQWTVRSGSLFGHGKFLFSLVQAADGLHSSANFNGDIYPHIPNVPNIAAKEKPYALKGDLKLEKKYNDASNPWKGNLLLDLSQGIQSIGRASVSIAYGTTMAESFVKASYKKGAVNVALSSTLRATNEKLEALLKVSAHQLIPELANVATDDCKIDLGLETKKKKLQVDCPMQISLGFNRSEDTPYSRLLKKLVVKLHADVRQAETGQGSEVEGKVELTADPLFAQIKEGVGKVSIIGKGKISEPFAHWKYKAESTLEVQRIHKLTEFFAKTAWAVPEPFSDLDGPLKVQIAGEGELGNGGIEFPVNITTQFTSDRQTLNLGAEGKIILPLGAAQGGEINGQIVLSDVQLVLPPLDPYAIPRPLPDDRIHRKPVKTGHASSSSSSSSNPLKIALNVVIPKERPLRLLSGVTGEPIPIGGDVTISSDSSMTGELQVYPFSVVLFRRTAKVNRVKILIKPNSDENEIHGSITIQYADYLITILIDGLIDRPRIQFMSDPPLSEKQVMAVLLFGRSFDALEEDEIQSVSATRNALADGAVGLVSMYALASTPVESVGYDAATRSFAAKVKLADGTSFNVGTNLKQVQSVGVKQRLGPHWNIKTFLENPFLEGNRSLTTFLEWHWRY